VIAVFRGDIDWFRSSKNSCKISLSQIILNLCLVTGNGAFDSCVVDTPKSTTFLVFN